MLFPSGAGYYSAKGIILVSAGMDFDKEPLVRAEALKQLEACCRGDISGEELTAARRSLVSALESVPDSPGALESYYSAIRLGGSALDPQAHRPLWRPSQERTWSAVQKRFGCTAAVS